MRLAFLLFLCLVGGALSQEAGTECETASDCEGLSGCNMRPLCMGGNCVLTFVSHGDACCMKAVDCPIVDCQTATCERFTCVYPEGSCEPTSSSSMFISSGDDSSEASPSSFYSSLTSYDAGEDDDSGNYVESGCVYQNNRLVSCVEVEPFDCSSTFGFKLWIPVDNSSAKMILAADSSVSVLAHEFSRCYRLPGASCRICLYFDPIFMFYTQSSVTAEVQGKYAFMCDDSHNIYEVDFGVVSGTNDVCGADGYYYLPCDSETPYTITGAPSLASRDVSTVADAPTAAVYPEVEQRARSDSLIVDGQCVYMRAHSEDVLLYCFTATFDSCSGNGFLTSVAGVQYHLPLFAVEHEGGVAGCEPTSAGGQFICVRVTHIHSSGNSLEISVTTAITEDGVDKAALDMGTFSFDFPSCRQRNSQCDESDPPPAVYVPPTATTTTGVVATPPGQVPAVPHVTSASGSSSVFWVLLGATVLVAFTVGVVLALVGTVVYLKRRRDSFSNPETAYQMMIM